MRIVRQCTGSVISGCANGRSDGICVGCAVGKYHNIAAAKCEAAMPGISESDAASGCKSASPVCWGHANNVLGLTRAFARYVPLDGTEMS